MTSKRWCGAIFGTLLALAPVASSAAPITVSIGSFRWEQSFFGESFTLTNDSALFSGLAGDFTDVSLLLTADYDFDGIPDAPFSDFPTTLGSVPVGNSYGQDYEGPLFSVRLQFSYAPTGLPALVFDQSFAGPDDPFFARPFIDYTYDVVDPDPDPNPAPVPEPSSLVLLSLGLGGAVAKKWRTRRMES